MFFVVHILLRDRWMC